MVDLGKPKFRIERWAYFYAPNAAMLRLELEREGYRVFQWSDAPNMIYPQHKHETAQSHWIVRGALELNVDGQIYVLQAGDRDFMEAEVWHSARIVSDEPVLYLIGEKLPEEKPLAKRRRKKVK